MGQRLMLPRYLLVTLTVIASAEINTLIQEWSNACFSLRDCEKCSSFLTQSDDVSEWCEKFKRDYLTIHNQSVNTFSALFPSHIGYSQEQTSETDTVHDNSVPDNDDEESAVIVGMTLVVSEGCRERFADQENFATALNFGNRDFPISDEEGSDDGTRDDWLKYVPFEHEDGKMKMVRDFNRYIRNETNGEQYGLRHVKKDREGRSLSSSDEDCVIKRQKTAIYIESLDSRTIKSMKILTTHNNETSAIFNTQQNFWNELFEGSCSSITRYVMGVIGQHANFDFSEFVGVDNPLRMFLGSHHDRQELIDQTQTSLSKILNSLFAKTVDPTDMIQNLCLSFRQSGLTRNTQAKLLSLYTDGSKDTSAISLLDIIRQNQINNRKLSDQGDNLSTTWSTNKFISVMDMQDGKISSFSNFAAHARVYTKSDVREALFGADDFDGVSLAWILAPSICLLGISCIWWWYSSRPTKTTFPYLNSFTVLDNQTPLLR